MILTALKSAQAWITAIPQIVVVSVVTLPSAFLLGQCDGKASEKARQEAARTIANAKAEKTNAAANVIAANERRIDETLNRANTQDLLDAVAETPQTAPDAARVALGCSRLRAYGTSEAALPGACRTGAGAAVPVK